VYNKTHTLVVAKVHCLGIITFTSLTVLTDMINDIHLIFKISLSCSAPDSQAETAETPLQVNVPRFTSLDFSFSFNFTSSQQSSESRGIHPTLLRLNSVFPGVLNSK